MPTRSNEQLCRMAQKGDTAARDILLEKNLGFIRKIALEQYRNMGLDENDIGIDLDDLMQEGSIGLLNAIPLFDAGRGMKFLTYAAPALRNAMTDCIRAALKRKTRERWKYARIVYQHVRNDPGILKLVRQRTPAVRICHVKYAVSEISAPRGARRDRIYHVFGGAQLCFAPCNAYHAASVISHQRARKLKTYPG